MGNVVEYQAQNPLQRVKGVQNDRFIDAVPLLISKSTIPSRKSRKSQ